VGKHLRDYRRIAMNPKTAEVIARLGRLTDTDHATKCADELEGDCRHRTSGTLAVADLLRTKLKIGQKRGYLDLPDPYNTNDHEAARAVLRHLASRILAFTNGEKGQTTKALLRVVEEVRNYADRSPLEVIAEAALWKTP